MKRVSAACALAILLGVSASDSNGARNTWDYLVPVRKETGSGAAYERLWRQKLLVTNGEIARFVGLPGNVGEETSVSIYRRTIHDGNDQYWVTATQASERLSNAIPQPGVNKTVDPQKIAIQRCDAPLPDSTAITIRHVWIAMLSQIRAEPKSDAITIDSSTEIFSAIDASGKLLQGQTSSKPGKDSLALVELALSLMEYCDAPASRRVDKAREIEREATDLLNRVSKR